MKYDWHKPKRKEGMWNFAHKTQYGSTKHLDYGRNERVYKKFGIVTKKYSLGKNWW